MARPVGRPRQPAALIEAKGKAHISKEDIEERKAQEIKCYDTRIVPPETLTDDQAERFAYIAGILNRIGIWSELDATVLAQFIQSSDIFDALTGGLRKAISEGDIEAAEAIQRQQDRAFKQSRACASSLGLDITSRCAIIAPVVEAAEKENPFTKFQK